jgi:hypothetical protein
VIIIPAALAEHARVNKPHRRPAGAKPLSELLRATLNESFARQGFASTELVSRWAEIAGPEVAVHSEPVKIQWPRPVGDEPPAPATLMLRVEGPAALEIQHLSGVIIERVNRFFGWQAIGRIALRQAPLSRRRDKPQRRLRPDPAETARIAAALPAITDDDLRAALARLGAAIKVMCRRSARRGYAKTIATYGVSL